MSLDFEGNCNDPATRENNIAQWRIFWPDGPVEVHCGNLSEDLMKRRKRTITTNNNNSTSGSIRTIISIKFFVSESTTVTAVRANRTTELQRLKDKLVNTTIPNVMTKLRKIKDWSFILPNKLSSPDSPPRLLSVQSIGEPEVSCSEGYVRKRIANSKNVTTELCGRFLFILEMFVRSLPLRYTLFFIRMM